VLEAVVGEGVVRGSACSTEERLELIKAIEVAGQLFRRELLRATDGWTTDFLAERGLQAALAAGSRWKVGYARDSRSQLTDQLQRLGFSSATLVRAGLMEWAADSSPVDRIRDQLVLVSRDSRLAAVGLVGIDRNGQARSAVPVTPIHRPTNVLVGVYEQIDLLQAGATPVIVDDPLDAIVIDEVSRASSKPYAGIPLCGAPLSPAQTRMLARYSETDRVVVAVPAEDVGRRRAVRAALDLARYFSGIKALVLPPGTAISHYRFLGRVSAGFTASSVSSQESSKPADDGTARRDD